MQMEESQPRQESSREDRLLVLAVLGLTLLAFALRFFKLGEWGFDSDETFTLRDSLNLRLSNPRPLGYLLNHVVVRPFLPLDEFGIRLLPAIFGSLAIPVFYVMMRRLIGTRAALFGALLLTFNPLHVIYSQFGRYWALVFLLCTIYPYALYLGVREHRRGMLLLGMVTGILASLAHPVAVLLIGGPAIWLSFRYLRPAALRSLWNNRTARWVIGIACLVGVLLLVRFVPILLGWISEHDQNLATGEFLRRPRADHGIRQLIYLLIYVEGWTFPLVLTGLVGIASLWQERDRTLARYLTSVALFPAVLLPLIMLRTSVSTYYLIPIAPVFFMGAGVFLDRVFAMDWRLRPHWLVPGAVTLVILAAGVPTLVSQYRNGRRFDIRGAAQWLQPQLTQADVIYSEQPAAMVHYLPGHEVRFLRLDPEALAGSLRELDRSGPGATLWVVAPAPSHAFRATLREGGLARWLYRYCDLRNTIGSARVDFRHQFLQIYRCPAAATGSSTSPRRLSDTSR
jgi:uncharacterized membrane protein